MKMIMCMGLVCVGVLWAGPICDQKRAVLAKKADFAKQMNNLSMLQDVQKAMTSIEKFCDDIAVIADTKKKIMRLENKILETQEEMAEYQAKGKISKIQKKQFEIGAIEAELQEAKDELNLYESLQ